MSATESFAGLSMPVFTAFGWAGEETATNYALSQLELFIESLYRRLPREAQYYLSFYGVNKEAKTVYLASHSTPDEGAYVTFNARPTAFEVRLSVTNEAVLARGLKASERHYEDWYRHVNKLEGSWKLHLQQKLVDDESAAVSTYQDLYHDAVTELDEAQCETLLSRAAFLNSEVKWVVPFHLVYTMPAEQASHLGIDLTAAMQDVVNQLIPFIDFFTHQSGIGKRKKSSPRKTNKPRPSKKASEKAAVVTEKKETAKKVDSHQFEYTSCLKPLHIRKGFINLTTDHWPFFALNARSGSRPVVVLFNGKTDKHSMVWRLTQANDMARIVLGDTSKLWLETTFQAEDEIRVTATKGADNQIEIALAAAE